MNPTRRVPVRQRLIDSARLSARLQGCTCLPLVDLREPRPGVIVADLAHDSWCPLGGGRR